MDNYSLVNANQYAQIPICERVTMTELVGDFTLPDYQPEIKRLLWVCANVLPPSKYLGDSKAEFAGNIDYFVYYTGSDNEIYCAPLSEEYKIEVPIEKGTEWQVSNLTGNAYVVCDLVSGRVTSPRKLNVKCRLKSYARIFGDAATNRGFEDSNGDNEVLTCVSPLSRTLFASSDMVRLSDEMIIDNQSGEVRVVCADGRALISEVNCTESQVSCRGDVYLKMLMSHEQGGAPTVVTRKIPFSQGVDVEGVGGKCQATASATVCEMSIDVEESRIAIDLGMLIDVTAHKNERVSYVKDVYSTVYKTEGEYSTLPVQLCGAAMCTNFTLSDSMTLEEAGMPRGCSVIDSSGVAVTEKVQYDADGRMTMSGKAKFNLLTQKDGEYAAYDIELPFKYSAITPITDGAHAMGEPMAYVVSTRHRVDGERVGIDAEIYVSGCMSQSGDISVLDKVNFGEEIERTRGGYVICYPSGSDSLWSVAKRYGKAVSDISERNGISNEHAYDSSESLKGNGYLII